MPSACERFWHYMRMVEDAIDRAKDGAEGEAWERQDLDYSCKQLEKAYGWLQGAIALCGGPKEKEESACISANGRMK